VWLAVDNTWTRCKFGYTKSIDRLKMQTTVFRNGGSQAIRIPAQFRFEGDSVDVEWDDSLNALIVRQSPLNHMNDFFTWVAGKTELALPKSINMKDDGRMDVKELMDLED
jgi:virulence-associated protein VagC